MLQLAHHQLCTCYLFKLHCVLPCAQRRRRGAVAAAAAANKTSAAALPANKAELKKLSKVGRTAATCWNCRSRSSAAPSVGALPHAPCPAFPGGPPCVLGNTTADRVPCYCCRPSWRLPWRSAGSAWRAASSGWWTAFMPHCSRNRRLLHLLLLPLPMRLPTRLLRLQPARRPRQRQRQMRRPNQLLPRQSQRPRLSRRSLLSSPAKRTCLPRLRCVVLRCAALRCAVLCCAVPIVDPCSQSLRSSWRSSSAMPCIFCGLRSLPLLC